MASLGADGDFTGKLRLPLPDTFSGQPADWEEWAWNFKAYISMFETGAVALLDRAEMMNDELTDETLQVILDTGDVDQDATAARVLFSRKLHYLLSQLVKDSAKNLLFDKMMIRMALKLGVGFMLSLHCQMPREALRF